MLHGKSTHPHVLGEVEEPPSVCTDGSTPWPPPRGTQVGMYPRPEIWPVRCACAVCGVAVAHDESGVVYETVVAWRAFWPARICGCCAAAFAFGRGSAA